MENQDTIITDEELANLPDDDKLAFAFFERHVRAKTLDRIGPDEGSTLQRQYVNYINGFIDAVNLDIDLEGQAPFTDSDFWPWYNKFLQFVDRYTLKYRLEHARGIGGGVVSAIHISGDYREEIHKLLGRIRKVVNQADITEEKKNSIYVRIADLQSVIDRTKTPFEAFLSRFLDLTNALGEGAENLKPAANLLKRVIEAFGRAKADQDQGNLPPPEDTKNLPAPNTPEQTKSELDDEIPF